MPLFPGSKHTTINDGHFIDQSVGAVINNIQLVNGQPGIDILLEKSSRDAAYDSSVHDYAPRCHPGTRQQYIEDIIDWAAPAVSADYPLPLFWVKGPAGVGKSAVARTCAEKLKELGKLGATFFFAVNERDDAAQFFPTISYQLSTEFPEYRDLINRRICRDKTILDKTLETQFKTLIVEPLEELEKVGKGIGRRIPILIDGLDECKSTDAQYRLIEIIAAASNGVVPLCWAIFSRPTSHIEAAFSLAHINKVTCMTQLSISRNVDSDIELYLRSGLENILRCRNIPPENSQWPLDDYTKALVRASAGLFIYAATALRVIAQPGSLEKALHAVCATASTRTKNAIKSPFTELDSVYMLIMNHIPPDELPTILLLCAILCNGRVYAGCYERGITLQSNLLALCETDFRTICGRLSAVLQFHDRSDPLDLTRFGGTDRPFQYTNPTFIQELWDYTLRLGGSVGFYHKSFYDFLIDPTRSGTFCVTSPAMRTTLFNHYLDLLFKYEESYSFQGSELVLAPGILSSASSLPYPSTNELVNSTLKAVVYRWLFGNCFDLGGSLQIGSQSRQRLGHVDFRKALKIRAMLYAGRSSFVGSSRWGYGGHGKITHEIQLFQISTAEFRRFDVVGFNGTIKRLEEGGIIHPYYPDFVSRFKSLFPKKSQGKLVSGLYRMGRDSKSIFWYWEINHELGYYQEFRAADLVEGERVYREEQWPGRP